MDRARPFPDAARSLVTLSNPQTPFAELATHRRKALRHFFTWFAGVIARAEGGSGQSLTQATASHLDSTQSGLSRNMVDR